MEVSALQTGAMGSEQWRRQLVEGAAKVGVTLDDDRAECMRCHADLLMQWNSRVNLTAITRPEEILVKHMVDSIAAVPYIPDRARLLDIGSGGGFPGLPLKITLPHLDATLIDASRKKVSFVRHVIRTLSLQGIQGIHERAERLVQHPDHSGGYDVVVCRALTSMDRFITLARPFLKKNGRIVAYRGGSGDNAGNGEQKRDDRFKWQEVSFRLPSAGAQRRLLLLDLT